MQRYELDIIGTHLTISMGSEANLSDLFESIKDRLEKFEAKYSRFIEGNWLDNLNKNREGELDQDGLTMLSYVLEVARASDGYFDPTVGKRLTELGYGRKMTHDRGQMTGQKQGNYRDIEIVGNRVKLHSDVILEFGGVGKGYLIDVIKEMIDGYFSEKGINTIRYLIDFGGDLYGKGGWSVGLEHPTISDEVIGVIMLDDHFLACSSGSKRRWGDHHHLIDPKTGESAHEVIATYIEGSSSMSVDVYATALCVMPHERACETLANDTSPEGVILASDGRCYQSEGSRSELFLA